MSDSQLSIRCVVVGDNGVGKSTLIQSYVNGKFTENLEEITDMPNVEKLRSELYVGVDVCILCYSMANEESLENIEYKWIKEVKDYCPERPCILVGMKGDLCNELEEHEKTILETEDMMLECFDHVVKVFRTSIRVALADANLNRNHTKCGFSWSTSAEYIGSIINQSLRMAKCTVPVLRQTAINVRESWNNPNAFVEAKHNLLYYVPFLAPCVPLTKTKQRKSYANSTENKMEKHRTDQQHQVEDLINVEKFNENVTQSEEIKFIRDRKDK